MKMNGEGRPRAACMKRPDSRDLLCLEGKRAPWVRVSATLSVWGRLGWGWPCMRWLWRWLDCSTYFESREREWTVESLRFLFGMCCISGRESEGLTMK